MADTQEMVTQDLESLARAYFGGLAHNHTLLSNHPGHHESDLTMDRFVGALVEAGLAGAEGAPIGYVMFNEHPSDPARPRRLMPWSQRARRLLQQRRRAQVAGVPI